MNKGFTSIPLSFNRKMVMASVAVTKQKSAIHSFAEIDITEPRRLIKAHFEKTGEKLSLTAYIVSCLAQVIDQHPRLNAFIKRNKLILLNDVTVNVHPFLTNLIYHCITLSIRRFWQSIS